MSRMCTVKNANLYDQHPRTCCCNTTKQRYAFFRVVRVRKYTRLRPYHHLTCFSHYYTHCLTAHNCLSVSITYHLFIMKSSIQLITLCLLALLQVDLVQSRTFHFVSVWFKRPYRVSRINILSAGNGQGIQQWISSVHNCFADCFGRKTSTGYRVQAPRTTVSESNERRSIPIKSNQLPNFWSTNNRDQSASSKSSGQTSMRLRIEDSTIGRSPISRSHAVITEENAARKLRGTPIVPAFYGRRRFLGIRKRDLGSLFTIPTSSKRMKLLGGPSLVRKRRIHWSRVRSLRYWRLVTELALLRSTSLKRPWIWRRRSRRAKSLNFRSWVIASTCSCLLFDNRKGCDRLYGAI